MASDLAMRPTQSPSHEADPADPDGSNARDLGVPETADEVYERAGRLLRAGDFHEALINFNTVNPKPQRDNLLITKPA